MARIRHSAERIINKLRQAEVLLGQGLKVPEVTKQLGVSASHVLGHAEFVPDRLFQLMKSWHHFGTNRHAHLRAGVS